MNKHSISLEDLDFEEIYNRNLKKMQERLKKINGEDCFKDRDIKYCSVYGMSCCNRKCLYAKAQDIAK